MARKMLDEKASKERDSESNKSKGGAVKKGLFKEFWNIDIQKTKGQAVITFMFFSAILALMDSVVYLPFVGRPEALEVLEYVKKFPPSFFVGVALTVIVALGRVTVGWKKVVSIIIAIAGGLQLSSAIALVPVLWLLGEPVLEGPLKTEEAPIDEKVTHTTLTQQVPGHKASTQTDEAPVDSDIEPKIISEDKGSEIIQGKLTDNIGTASLVLAAGSEKQNVLEVDDVADLTEIDESGEDLNVEEDEEDLNEQEGGESSEGNDAVEGQEELNETKADDLEDEHVDPMEEFLDKPKD